jgi:hypothetical protein
MPACCECNQELARDKFTVSQLKKKEEKRCKSCVAKSMPTPTCANCGEEGADKQCARCKQVGYCSRECQAAHWKNGHREICAQIAAPLKHPCPECKLREDDADEPFMCYYCGHFNCCGTCYGNFIPDHLSEYCKDGAIITCICASCYLKSPEPKSDLAKQLDKVAALETLLADKPTGRHSVNARYMLCSLKLYEHVDETSFLEVQAARKELVKLGLEESHGPSLFALACLHDDGAYRYNDGPIHIDPKHKHFKTDPDKHRKYLKASAKQGFTKAVMEVGTCYKNGSSGFPKDWKLAQDYLEQAATQGDQKAMVNISEIFLKGGNGVVSNPAKAFKYIKKAATKYDNANAMFMLFQFSRMREKPGPINIEEGVEWLFKSAELGFPPAKSFMDSMPF